MHVHRRRGRNVSSTYHLLGLVHLVLRLGNELVQCLGNALKRHELDDGVGDLARPQRADAGVKAAARGGRENTLAKTPAWTFIASMNWGMW